MKLWPTLFTTLLLACSLRAAGIAPPGADPIDPLKLQPPFKILETHFLRNGNLSLEIGGANGEYVALSRELENRPKEGWSDADCRNALYLRVGRTRMRVVIGSPVDERVRMLVQEAINAETFPVPGDGLGAKQRNEGNLRKWNLLNLVDFLDRREGLFRRDKELQSKQ